MIPDFKKSIDNILHDRLSSPFFGAFLFSWCVWNWRIIYLTIFISGDKIEGNKIDFIINNYSDKLHLICGPLWSTAFLILIYPLIATGAFWVSLKFEKLKSSIKNTEEKTLLLSVEKSIELREELRNQDDKFDKLLARKGEEITLLKAEIESYRKQLNSTISNDVSSADENTSSKNQFDVDYEAMKANKQLFEQFKEIAPRALKSTSMFPTGHQIDSNLFDYFLANEIIQKVPTSTALYVLTSKGKHFHKRFIDETLTTT